VVFTQEEVRRLLSFLAGPEWLMANLLYGAGLRLLECLELRIKDIDFDSQQNLIRKRQRRKKTAVTLLLEPSYQIAEAYRKRRELHRRDLAQRLR